MKLKTKARNVLNKIFMRFNYQLIHNSRLHDWQKHDHSGPSYNKSRLPEGAESYLQVSNPALEDLEKRYAEFDKSVTEPLVWKDDLMREEDVLYFRGDNAYVYQRRGSNMGVSNYALSTYYLKSIDEQNLLSKLTEDELFGNYAFTIADMKVSRDLLDSIMEIYFLDKHLQVLTPDKHINVLDIGAGYGRLAHRLLSVAPGVDRYFCADAVAVSTFISDYYLRFRQLQDRASVVPLDEIEGRLENQRIDLAINIHSFSECKIAAIEWWLQLVSKHKVKNLMIVPNSGVHGGQLLLTNDQKDFEKIIEKHGYRLVAKDPKYGDPVVQEFGVNPTFHYLFELQ
jgi:hypothetical protein